MIASDHGDQDFLAAMDGRDNAIKIATDDLLLVVERDSAWDRHMRFHAESSKEGLGPRLPLLSNNPPYRGRTAPDPEFVPPVTISLSR